MSTFECLRGVKHRSDDARNGSVQYGEFTVASDIRADYNQNSERTGKVKELLQGNSSRNWQYI